VKRPLVVTDRALGDLRICVAGSLAGAKKKATNWFLYSGVHPNPVEDDVLQSAQAYAPGVAMV
jgi:alcohol dehydrogenase class IV